MATRRTPVHETKPLVVGDWLSDKDIVAWLNDKVYHNEAEEPRAWTMAVTHIASCLKRMRKYEDSKGNNHTIVALAWRQHHIFIYQWLVISINRCIFVMRWPTKGEAWMMLLLRLCQKDSSRKHCASSMQIAPSESPAPSRRMGGRRRRLVGSLENLLLPQPPTLSPRPHLPPPPF